MLFVGDDIVGVLLVIGVAVAVVVEIVDVVGCCC